MAFRLASSGAAFVAVMALFGAAQSWWAVAVLPAAVLTGLAFATPAAAWARHRTSRRHRSPPCSGS